MNTDQSAACRWLDRSKVLSNLVIGILVCLLFTSCDSQSGPVEKSSSSELATLHIDRPPAASSSDETAVGKDKDIDVTAAPREAETTGGEDEVYTNVFTYLAPFQRDTLIAAPGEELTPPVILREILEQKGVHFGPESSIIPDNSTLYRFFARNTYEELEKIRAICLQQNIKQLAIFATELRFRLEIFSLPADPHITQVRSDLSEVRAGPAAEKHASSPGHATLRQKVLDLVLGDHATLRDCLHLSNVRGKECRTTSGADFFELSAVYETQMRFLTDRPETHPPSFPPASAELSKTLRHAASGTYLSIESEGHYDVGYEGAEIQLRLTHFTAAPRPPTSLTPPIDLEKTKVGWLHHPEVPSVRFAQTLNLADGETRLIAAVRDPAFPDGDSSSAPLIAIFLTFDPVTYSPDVLREQAARL